METASISGSPAAPSATPTPERKALVFLLAGEEPYRAAFEHAPFGACEQNLEGRYLAVNRKLCEITGFTREEMLGMSSREITHPDDLAASLAATDAFLQGGSDNLVREHRYLRKDGSPVWVHLSVALLRDGSGEPQRLLLVVTDIDEQVNYRTELLHQASHDALTGLANRSLLNERLERALVRAGRNDEQMAIVLIDLDRFKDVNDSLGHAVGDQLLNAVAAKISACVRDVDTLARTGGDEFALILVEQASDQDVLVAMGRILSAVSGQYQVAGHELHVSCGIGASLYPRDGRDAGTLLKNADAAMYRAKEGGRNRFQLYQKEINVRLDQRLSLETKLRHALERQELLLHYQPQISLDSGAIVGVEALLRWRHPELGLVSPDRFIAIAEDTGLIVPIGEWVLASACAQAQSWREAGLPQLRMAVNISARQFRHKGLADAIRRVLAQTGLDAGLLEVEITESMAMHDPEETLRLLGALKECGLRIALDDFGTGFSSLSYLKRFPIDVLKIDQSFVRGIVVDRHDAAIARTVIGLARSLDLKTIAEGVETAEQGGLLRTWTCDDAQGYHFSLPLPAENATEMLRARRCFPVRH